MFIGDDIRDAVGSLQLCAGHDNGIEAAIHAMRAVVDNPMTEAILLADASNAFNCLNREVCLRNIQQLCPSLAPMVINTYRQPSKLFVDGEVISSCEGTTQGDPIAMPMYALGVLPLIKSVATPDATQVWYADDSGSGGKLPALFDWWRRLNKLGPAYGYFPNASKSVLYVKPAFYQDALEIFAGTGVIINTKGCRYLGAALGSKEFVDSYIKEKVSSWIHQVQKLSIIAKSQPQSAYAAFVHGFQNKWVFLCRTMPNMAQQLQPLDDAITSIFIPALLGRTVSVTDRSLLALPCRFGGIGLTVPSTLASQNQSSIHISSSLVQRILDQDYDLGDAIAQIRTIKRQEWNDARNAQKAQAIEFSASLGPDCQRVLELSSEKGASSWLTCRPMRRHGFNLSKGEFRDAMCLRYNWLPQRLPTSCQCGQAFSVTHALSCPLGGFPTLRHNEVRDITAGLIKQVAHQVTVEPHLQPLSGEHLRYSTANNEDQARLDVAASGVWGGRFDRTLIDIRVFNPYAASNRSTSLTTCYAKHEKEKKRTYERVLNVEHASFVPVVLSSTGGMSKCASILYKRIASMLSSKTKEPYNKIIASIRCRISFSLLRSSIMCLRGARRIFPSPDPSTSVALTVAEAAIPLA